MAKPESVHHLADRALATRAKEPVRPTSAQRRYLARGLDEPGGKLPLFDEWGQEIDARTITSCLARGWCEPWYVNPVKTDWLVCKLTRAGYRALDKTVPDERQ